MAKEGILPTLDDMFGPGGRALIAQMPFEGAYSLRVDSLLKLLDHYAGELVVVEAALRGDNGLLWISTAWSASCRAAITM